MPDEPDEHPLAGIDRNLAGVLRLVNLAEAQDRAPFEQVWWSLRGMKRGVVAALSGVMNHERRMHPTGAALLRTLLDEERACTYQHAARIGLVPRVGGPTTARSLSGSALRFNRGDGASAPPSSTDSFPPVEVGTALTTLLGL
ncbi:hypothetical protein [Nannocystis bainbridge]|uniref:Uncharacterized protein n=1 Tax=Nannocystis bainbridge TaxID=2995303 RepID=A0ABT5ECH8_9BACT|nr:hypothetical protein [Nannocystis bainbridge]MDC0722491.1 hypothetical protein [Nannocystis bainbridge]